MKQTSQLREVPVRCLSRDFLFSCTRCAGPCNSLRAANSWSQSSHSPDITLPVHYNCKFCVKPKENITSTITGFMLLEAETQEIFLSARCSHCPGNTSKYVFPQVMNHGGTEGRAYFFFLLYSKSLFSFLKYSVAEEKHFPADISSARECYGHSFLDKRLTDH